MRTAAPINWNQVKSETPELFESFKEFLAKKNISIEDVDKEAFNAFITESKFPKFLNVPDEYDMNHYVVLTTFTGIKSFSQLNTKKQLV